MNVYLLIIAFFCTVWLQWSTVKSCPWSSPVLMRSSRCCNSPLVYPPSLGSVVYILFVCFSLCLQSATALCFWTVRFGPFPMNLISQEYLEFYDILLSTFKIGTNVYVDWMNNWSELFVRSQRSFSFWARTEEFILWFDKIAHKVVKDGNDEVI